MADDPVVNGPLEDSAEKLLKAVHAEPHKEKKRRPKFKDQLPETKLKKGSTPSWAPTSGPAASLVPSRAPVPATSSTPSRGSYI
ncbi:hypothetical protein BC832DRAFT_568610 [Gaertneriomyces semiglobifer]|nr:hypothetical protein BC832DRAFT_568610 [Gaertneriomyces semiglobifer]